MGGETLGFDKVFVNYGSAVDWPSALYWREIPAYYLEAKVLLSVSLEDKWSDSVHATIFLSMASWDTRLEGHRREAGRMPYETVCNQVFDSKPADRDHSRVAYRSQIAEV